VVSSHSAEVHDEDTEGRGPNDKSAAQGRQRQQNAGGEQRNQGDRRRAWREPLTFGRKGNPNRESQAPGEQ